MSKISIIHTKESRGMKIKEIIDSEIRPEVFTNEELTRRIRILESILEIFAERLERLDNHEIVIIRTTEGLKATAVEKQKIL